MTGVDWGRLPPRLTISVKSSRRVDDHQVVQDLGPARHISATKPLQKRKLLLNIATENNCDLFLKDKTIYDFCGTCRKLSPKASLREWNGCERLFTYVQNYLYWWLIWSCADNLLLLNGDGQWWCEPRPSQEWHLLVRLLAQPQSCLLLALLLCTSLQNKNKNKNMIYYMINDKI